MYRATGHDYAPVMQYTYARPPHLVGGSHKTRTSGALVAIQLWSRTYIEHQADSVLNLARQRRLGRRRRCHLLSSRRLDWPTHCSSRRGNTRRRCWLALLSSLESTRLGEGSLVGARHGHGLEQAGTKQYTQQGEWIYNATPSTCSHDCYQPCAMSSCEGQRRACSRSVADRQRRMTNILRHLLMYNIPPG